MRIFLPLCLCVLLASFSVGQIVTITAPQLITPTVLDFDTGAPAAGNISPFDPYFLGFGLAEVNIVNAPGVHTPAGDLLSSGFIGSCLASVNNTLAIVAPNGPMDNHTLGAGWKFVLTPGTVATQFGGLIVDQINHMMSVETWFGGILQNTYTFTMTSPTGGFPNPYIYFEDLSGFDEVRFQNVGVAGGWGIDEFTLGNAIPIGGFLAPWALNSPESSTDINGVQIGSVFAGPANTNLLNGASGTVTFASSLTPNPFEVGINVAPAVAANVAPGFNTPIGAQAVNFDIFTAIYMNGGSTLGFAPHPGTLSFNLTMPNGVVVCAQQIVIDPGNADGFTLSQCSQVTGLNANCINSPTATNTLAGGDSVYTHTLGSGGFTFYGSSYTTLYVNSNGNITFGSGSYDFTETENEFLAQQPRIAPAWNNFDASVGGQVNVEEIGGVFTATWFEVPEYFMPTTQHTFCADLDLTTGAITLGYGSMSMAGNNNGLVGISPGGGLSSANNLDLTAGPITVPNANDAIYEDFNQGTYGGFDLANGTQTFIPTGGGGIGPYMKQ